MLRLPGGLTVLLTAVVLLLGALALRPAFADDRVLPDLGEAPELTNDVWINSDTLRLADLRGKVVLLEFWTFGCYNCKNTLPYVKAAYDTYKNKGVEFIGVHFPEFNYERDVNNVRAFVKQEGITYPVAIDNDGIAWNAYQMHAWPAFIIIDKQGHMRFRQIGEGRYERISAALDALIAEPGPGIMLRNSDSSPTANSG
ncbi:MAG: redoxin domain-containing protein [Anaerolineae bacterium]|nr:redoxin domain-containing protein [Anaerolineae bacterium]